MQFAKTTDVSLCSLWRHMQVMTLCTCTGGNMNKIPTLVWRKNTPGFKEEHLESCMYQKLAGVFIGCVGVCELFFMTLLFSSKLDIFFSWNRGNQGGLCISFIDIFFVNIFQKCVTYYSFPATFRLVIIWNKCLCNLLLSCPTIQHILQTKP